MQRVQEHACRLCWRKSREIQGSGEEGGEGKVGRRGKGDCVGVDVGGIGILECSKRWRLTHPTVVCCGKVLPAAKLFL